ncbi:MAG: 30S ribosomal protein S10 [Halobacteriales archaeon]
MTFVTTLTLASGDRATLDSVVEDIRDTAQRKGAEMKGPHTAPPTTYRVPLYSGLDDDRDRQLGRWRYTVYERTIEIVGHDELARSIASWDFPIGVHVEVEVDQIHPIGQGDSSGT